MLDNILPIILSALLVFLTVVPITYLIYNCIRLERERNDLYKINEGLLEEISKLRKALPYDWEAIQSENTNLTIKVDDLRSLRQLDLEARERLNKQLDEVTAKLNLQNLIEDVIKETKRLKDGI